MAMAPSSMGPGTGRAEVDSLPAFLAKNRPSWFPQHNKLMRQIIDQKKPFRELTSLPETVEINNFVFSVGVID